MTIEKSRDDYTVGWIAALPIEQAAASTMLDEEHGRLTDFFKRLHDGNLYTWGRIKDHNVVIAVLPAGTKGKVSAATMANHLLAAFPQIRFGLMVGIGGGIPQPEDDVDIRLGDIVVSQPSGIHGGVIQYNLGKARPGGTFERKGYLNAPPRALLTALAQLQAKHEGDPSSVPQILANMVERKPHMQKNYTYQGNENDKLFKADFLHSGGKMCRDCSAAEEVTQDNREGTNPQIHYGVIASGDIVVKDTAFRDAILKDVNSDCICCEMEAAGLMNDFLCLRYTAAVAAAYTKEFLGVIDRDELVKESKAADIIQSTLQRLKKDNYNHPGSVQAVAFLLDSKILVSAGSEFIQLWDTHSWTALQRLKRDNYNHPGFVKAVAFSPDSKILVSAGSEFIELWDTHSWTALRRLKRDNNNHPGSVKAVAFSPDGKILVSAGSKFIELWNI